MSDIITLSSDDEPADSSPRKKRIKLQPAKSLNTICLDSSDEEEKKTKSKSRTKKVEIIESSEHTATAMVTRNNLSKTCDTFQTNSECSKLLIIESKLNNFVEKCLKSITVPEYKERLSKNVYKIQVFYNKLVKLKNNADELECMLDYDKNNNYDTFNAIKRFGEIFDYIKSQVNIAESDALVSGPKRTLLKRLEKTLLKVRHKIRQLDEAEVNFDDDENSHYIQAARYKERAKKIYEKICELRKENPNSGRTIYAPLNFSKSKYEHFNKVINKKYKNTLEFPTFFELDKRLRQCVELNGLHIHEDDLKAEIKHCFEKLGALMKLKRRIDLHDMHKDYTHEMEDPAVGNEEMSSVLQENYTSGKKKMEELFEKYARMQETGVDPNVSPDSDDSYVAESD